MILHLLAMLLAWYAGVDADSERLRSVAPTYLTADQAVDHLWSARVAGAATGEDAALLLAIGWHESRYNWRAPDGAVSAEPGGRVSCGVMTPIPHAPPCPRVTLTEQYYEGAAHLAWWRQRVAHPVLGYAGLSGACAAGRVMRRGYDLCDYERNMLALARAIGGN